MINYTLITMWKTLDGTYYSNTATYSDKDKAVGNYHAKFLPMQNDTNVASFVLLLVDECGTKIEKCSWTRKTEETTEDVETGI